MTKYLVQRQADAAQLTKGDLITSFRDEPYTFEGCYHPRKILAKPAGAPVEDFAQEFYPSAFDLVITEASA